MSYNQKKTSSFDENTSTFTLTERVYKDFGMWSFFLAVSFFASMFFSVLVGSAVNDASVALAFAVISLSVILPMGAFFATTYSLRYELEQKYTDLIPQKLGMKINALSYGTYDLGTRNVVSSDLKYRRIQGQRNNPTGNDVSINTKLVISPFKQYIVETQTSLPGGLWDDALESAVKVYDFKE